MNQATAMHVYDVWARNAAGRTLHFDVVLTTRDDELALRSAQAWLASIGEETASVSAQTCSFCHTESAVPPDLAEAIQRQGYAIIKMEGCPG